MLEESDQFYANYGPINYDIGCEKLDDSFLKEPGNIPGGRQHEASNPEFDKALPILISKYPPISPSILST